MGALQGKSASSTQTLEKEPMAVNEYLEDVRVFLPAKMVMVHDNTAVVMVEREWLLETPEQRQVDADGAHVYLSNRAITSIELLWADGGLIARAGKDEKVVFADGTTGLIGKKSSGGDGGGAPPGLAGPGAP